MFWGIPRKNRSGDDDSHHCHHCEKEVDNAQHALEKCQAFEMQRNELVVVIGEDLSLTGITRALLAGGREKEAVLTFCEPPVSQDEMQEVVYPKPPRQTATGTYRRTKQCADQTEERENKKMMKEIQSLAEQISALKEIVFKYIKEGKAVNSNETAPQELPTETGKGTRNHEEQNKIKEKRERPAKKETSRTTGNAEVEVTQAPGTMEKTSTWARVVGRREKEAARKEKKAAQRMQQAKQQQEQWKRKQPTTKKDSRSESEHLNHQEEQQ